MRFGGSGWGVAALAAAWVMSSGAAQAQTCRFDDSGRNCVCSQGAAWRLAPAARCGGGASASRPLAPQRGPGGLDWKHTPYGRCLRTEPNIATTEVPSCHDAGRGLSSVRVPIAGVRTVTRAIADGQRQSCQRDREAAQQRNREIAELKGRTCMTRDEVREMQAALRTLGHYRGGVDGSLGPQTHRGMTAWAAQNSSSGAAPTRSFGRRVVSHANRLIAQRRFEKQMAEAAKRRAAEERAAPQQPRRNPLIPDYCYGSNPLNGVNLACAGR